MSLDWAGSMGALWARETERTDGVLGPLGDALLRERPPEALEAAAVGAPRRVVDLGCGAGGWIRQIAARLSPNDLAIGVDVSAPLLNAARSAPASKSGAALEWVLADAATYDFGAPLDAIYSRCGCMFFDDPVAAFTRLRAAMRPGAGFYAAVWASPRDNPWATAPLTFAADILGPDLSAPPPEGAPGPFAWSSPKIFMTILKDAGFHDFLVQSSGVSCAIGAVGAPDPVEEAVEASFTTGPLASRCRGLTPDQIDAIRARLRDAYPAHVKDGAVRFPGRGWLIAATA